MISSSATSPGTDLRVPGDIGSDVSALGLKNPGRRYGFFRPSLAAVLVILEWCLYQRRWTS